MSAITAISLIGASFAAISGVPLLSSKRFQAHADRLFGGLAVLAAFTLLAIAGERAGLAEGRRWIGRVDFLAALGVGPLLYLYERVIAYPARGLRRADLVHAIPGLAAAVPFLAWSGKLIDWMIPFPPILAIQLLYLWRAVAAWRVGKHNGPPAVPPATRYLAGTAVAIVALVNIGQLVRVLPGTRNAFEDIVPLFASAGFLTLGAHGLMQGLTGRSVRGISGIVQYRKSSLTTAAAKDGRDRLAALMTKEKLFRNAELTLDGLADQLSIPKHHLSQLLNQHLGETFTGYLTRLRVEDAKVGLLDSANDAFKIEAVARSAGFASRSAFYKAFRQATGQTPLAYRQSRRQG
jgi:AraC-like DNA-binding protein